MSPSDRTSDEPPTRPPVGEIPSDRGREPEEGIALCLSGGGYRAMLFHLGVLWRLYDAGRLRDVARVSSVSGGSITSAVLATSWQRLSFEPARVRDDFVDLVVDPVRRLAGKTIDRSSVLFGALLPGDIGDRVASAYARHLFGERTLQDLPDEPRFVFNATNVQSGALWRFMKPYMRDWRVGEVRSPTVPLARVVAASSAFPPVLSPVTLELDPDRFTPGSGAELQREPFTSEAVLSDGGVYDNLGLETCYKRYRTLLVSDAGGRLAPEEDPAHEWARHTYRVLSIIDNQVRSLRKRQLLDAFERGERKGVYWGIRSALAAYPVEPLVAVDPTRARELADVSTRLKRLDGDLQQRLINWGYTIGDAGLRAHVDPGVERGELPYTGTPI